MLPSLSYSWNVMFFVSYSWMSSSCVIVMYVSLYVVTLNVVLTFSYTLSYGR